MQPSQAAIAEYQRVCRVMGQEENLTRNAVTKRIKAALVKRSGVQWSVRGGEGTAYGWITITAPASRRQNGGSCMTDADRSLLGKLLGLPRPVHHQGETIPDSNDYYREYIDRAEEHTPRKLAEPYWD